MRIRDASPPAWRSIFALAGIALSIAAATYYGDPPGKKSTSRDRGREDPAAAPRPGTPGPATGAGAAPGKGIAPGPIVSPESGTDPAAGLGQPPGASADDGSPLSKAAQEIPRLAGELGRPVSVVSAQVIDPAGRPIPGVQVSLGDRESVSDSQGEVVLPLKSADLVLRHPEYFPRTIDPELRRGIAVPDAEGSCERLILVLFPGGHIAGRVVDPAGKPVAAAQVTTNGDEGAAVATDAKGGFRSPILRPGVHHLYVSHGEFQRADASVTIPAGGGEVPLTIALRPGARHELKALDVAGAPVPDAGVWLVESRPGGAEESRFAGRTGDDGRLALRWDPAEPHSARVIAPGFREEVHPLSGTGTVVTLQRAPLLTGQVIERERGLPARPTEVVLEIETREGFRRAPDRGILFRTLSAGKFRVGLPPFAGTYRVRALAEGDLSGASDSINFDGRSDPPPATVYLVQRTSLRGRVAATREGGGQEKVVQARIELYRHDLGEAMRLAYGVWFAAPPAPVAAVSADADGGFAFKDLKPGAYRVRVIHPQHADWLSAPVTVPLDAPLLCALRPGAFLRGTVFGPGGLPEADIPMVLVPPGSPFTSFTRTDGSGRYQFTNLAEGTYHLFTGDPRAEGSQGVQTTFAGPLPIGQGERSHPLTIRAGQELNYDVHRESRQLGGLTGKVSADGAPMAGVPLRVTPSRNEAAGPPADDEAVAGAGLARTALRQEKDSDEEGEEGPVAAGDPLARADLPSPEFEVTTGPDGGFNLDGLEPGRYRIAGGGLPVEQTIEVSSGRTTSLDIGLKTMTYQARLVDGLGGKPIEAEGAVEIIPEARGEARSVPIEHGQASAPGLYPGKYRLRIKLPGYLPFEGRFEMTPGAAEAPGGTLAQELRLRPGNTIQVAVIGVGGKPYRGKGEAVLLRKDGVEVHRAYGQFDGEVLLPVLPPGSYILTIRTDEGSTRMELEVSKDQKVDARLGGGR
jgi:carboxypeptidase family protein